MEQHEIREIFEAFFEKYKKTEGDRTSWSAHWTERMPSGVDVELNLTKCPQGTTFKVFKNGAKLGEIKEWDGFFEQIGPMLGEDWEPEIFFESMRSMT